MAAADNQKIKNELTMAAVDNQKIKNELTMAAQKSITQETQLRTLADQLYTGFQAQTAEMASNKKELELLKSEIEKNKRSAITRDQEFSSQVQSLERQNILVQNQLQGAIENS